jgi:uncharacterized protein YebE (UPF0316 family)
MDADVLLGAGGIFVLRVVGNMITTLRLITIMRGQRFVSTFLAIFEALIFAVALGSVVSNLDNLWNLSAYCLGYAAGGYLGMLVEHQFIQRYVSVNIISPAQWHEIATAIRAAGFGATEIIGQGIRGDVGTVRVVVGHRDVGRVLKLVQSIDPDAFVTTDELRAISRGYFRVARPEQRG